MLPQRVETYFKVVAISAFSFSLPLIAQERGGWQFDSFRANAIGSKSNVQQIYGVLLKMLDRWNAHDLETYMEGYWKSSELLVVIDAQEFNGWQQVHDYYASGYPDRNAMGFIEPTRTQIKLLKPDFALALTWWSVSFQTPKRPVVAKTTMDFQNFDGAWKIVESHTSMIDL
jgi:ketosteroid isomerase-like protein